MSAAPSTAIEASAPAPQPPQPPRRKRRRVTAFKHYGVLVMPPERGRPYFRLRFTDPATGKVRRTRLPPEVSSPALATEQAIKLHGELTRRRLEATLAGGPQHVLCSRPLVGELDVYMAAAAARVSKHGRPTCASTLRWYRRQLTQFAEWCAARDVHTLAELTRPLLAEWRASRLATPAHGRPRAVSTVNQEVKPVRQMLLAARAEGRLTHLDSDAVSKPLARLTQSANKPRCLNVPEIRATLRAALAFDASPQRAKHAPQFAPVLAVALLTGMRRSELAELRVGQVLFDKPSDYDPSVVVANVNVIRLRAEQTKTFVARSIAMGAPYSDALVGLMRELCAGRGPHERVLRMGYQRIGDCVWRLTQAGRSAPADLCMKVTRSTCASYQGPLRAHPKANADRLGHTMAIAESHYLALPEGTPTTAKSLEAVMKCGAELDAILASLQVWRVAASKRRKRKPSKR